MEKTQIANNLQKVSHQLKESTTVVVVTKTRTHQEVEEAIEGGAITIGENRVQEAEKKFNQIKKINKVEKRLIGPLQSNKVKRAIKAFDVIDTVGTVRLAKKISEEAKKINKKQRVLLQINSTETKEKNGFSFEEESKILECFMLKNIKIEGFMTMGPNTQNKQTIKRAFLRTAELYKKINNKKQNQMTTLSMGMSGDFLEGELAGSNMVRIGTAIFGPRK